MDLFDLVAKITLDSSEYDKGLKGAGEKASSFSKAGAAMWGVWSEVGRKAVSGVFNTLSSNMGGAVKRLDTLNNFPKVMQSLGFSAEEARAGIDNLANNIDHLPTTLDAVASQAQQFVPMTKNIEEATNITLALNNAMAAGGKDAESQQRAIEAWTKSMAKGKPEFEAWNAMVQTAPAQMDQLAQAMLGVGKGQNDLYEAMKNGSVSIDEVNDKMIELTNAADGFDIAGVHYDNFAKQAENASAGIQMSMTNVKAAVQRNLANVIDSFNTTTESIGGISGIISSTIPAINALGSTISGMLTGDISFEDGMMSLMNSFSAGARQAVSKGGELISNLMKGMADAAPALIEQGFVIISNIRQSVGDALPSLLSSGAELIGGIIQGVTEGIPYFVEGFSSIFSTLTKIVGEQGQGFIEKGLDLILGLSGSLREGAGNLVDSGLQLIESLAQGLANSMPALIQKVPLIVSNIANIINDNVPKILAAGVNIIVTLGKGLIQAIPTLIANIPQIITAIWDVFTAVNWLALGKTIVTAIASGIKSLASTLPTTLKGIGTKALNAIKGVSWRSVGSQIIRFITSAIMGVASLIPNALRSIGSRAMRAFTSISWGSVGSNIMRGIASGIIGGASIIISAAKNAAKSALNAAKNFLGIHSPSRVFRDEVGKNISLGIATGIEKNLGAVSKALDKVDPSLMTTTTTATTNQVGAVVTPNNAVGDVIINLNYTAGDDANDMVRDIARGIQRYKMAGVF